MPIEASPCSGQCSGLQRTFTVPDVQPPCLGTTLFMKATRTDGRRRGVEEMSTVNGNHLKYMLLGGAGAFGVLLLLGVPVASAVLYAALLACPLMMITMGGHGGHGSAGHDHMAPRSNQPDESVDRPNPQHQHDV